MHVWGKRLPEGRASWHWSQAVRYERGAIFVPFFCEVWVDPERWGDESGVWRHELEAHENGHALVYLAEGIDGVDPILADRAETAAFRAGASDRVPDAALWDAQREGELDARRLAHQYEVSYAWMQRRLELFFAAYPWARGRAA